MKINPQQIETLLKEKMPPADGDPVTVTNSIVIYLARELEMTQKALARIAKMVSGEEESPVAGAVGPGAAPGPGPGGDKTPFPAGLNVSAPPGSPQVVQTTAPVEDLTPNAGSGPAVNAAPTNARNTSITAV